jgi:phosphoenolpyruvate synthase/pyruvate phosphate dikinase
MFNYSLQIKLVRKFSRFCSNSKNTFLEPRNAVIQGCASSPGYYVGKACVIKNIDEDAHKFRPGTVLVGRFADPGWNDYIADAGALVLEMGQKVSHGPMIARRLGVPCVSELEIGEHMWENIQDGDEIIVRGNSGSIEIIGKQLKIPQDLADKIEKKKDIRQAGAHYLNVTIDELKKMEGTEDMVKELETSGMFFGDDPSTKNLKKFPVKKSNPTIEDKMNEEREKINNHSKRLNKESKS